MAANIKGRLKITEVNSTSYFMDFTVDKFEEKCPSGAPSRCDSPVVTVEHCGSAVSSSWQFVLLRHEDYLKYCLMCLRTEPMNLSHGGLLCKMSIYAGSKQEPMLHTVDEVTKTIRPGMDVHEWRPLFAANDERAHQLIDGGTLRVRVLLTIYDTHVQAARPPSDPPSEAEVIHGPFDVNVLCGPLQLKAHKSVLARSPILAQEVYGTNCDLVELAELEASTAKIIIDYLYTGIVKENVGILAVAAKVYAARPEIVQLIQERVTKHFDKKMVLQEELQRLIHIHGDAFV